MNLTSLPKETYEQFYLRNVREVNNYILTTYGLDWRTAARQWGETDSQGIYAQFYYMVGKLEYFISREKMVDYAKNKK